MTTTNRMTIRATAAMIASRCEDAYSADRYASWTGVAARLLRMGFNEAEVEAVMRSKITRWAADAEGKPYGHATVAAVENYIRNDEARRGPMVRNEIREWATAQVTA